MLFEVYNRFTQVSDITEEQAELLRQWCTKDYTYYGMDWSIRPVRRRKMTSSINYFSGFQKFPSGWAPTFAQRMKRFEHKVIFKDLRKRPEELTSDHPRVLIDYKVPPLRDYQITALELALKKTRGIIHHATGSGKTVIMAALLASLGVPTIIIVPDRNLLNQAYNEFVRFLGEDSIGKIGEGVFNPKFFTVGTIQTLWSRIKAGDKTIQDLALKWEAVFIDEAHHINIAGKNKINNTYFDITQRIDAFYRFGFTATPGQEDTLERDLLEATTGQVIHEVTSSELIKRGLLTRPTIQMYKIPIAIKYRDWREAYNKNILNNPIRNQLIIKLAEKLAAEGKSVLITVTRVKDHGEVLYGLIKDAVLMIGKTGGEERKKILEDFGSKKKKILISTVINEGVNIPSMDVIIMAGGGKSDRNTIQKIGRALRKSEGKEMALIIDFYDDDNGGMLSKHSKARLKVYKGEKEFKVNDLIVIKDAKSHDWTKTLNNN